MKLVSDIKIHPEFKNLIAPLSGEEYFELRASIKVDGIRDPLVVWNNILIDGYHRYKICQELNIDECPTYEKSFKDETEAKLWIINNQIGRRNLNIFKRVKMALSMKDYYSNLAKERQKLSPGRPSGKKMSEEEREKYFEEIFSENKKGLQKSGNLFKQIDTQQEIANLANASKDTVNKVETIFEYGSEQQISQLDNGKKSINEIYQTIRNKQKNISRPVTIRNQDYQIGLSIDDFKEQFKKVFDINFDTAIKSNDKLKELENNLGRFWNYISNQIGNDVDDFVKVKIDTVISKIENEKPLTKRLVAAGLPLEKAKDVGYGFSSINPEIRPYIKNRYDDFSEYVEEKIKFLEYKQKIDPNFERPIDFLLKSIQYDFRLKGQDYAEVLALKRERAKCRKLLSAIEDKKELDYRNLIDDIFYENPKLKEEFDPEVIYDKNDKLARVKENLNKLNYVSKMSEKLKQLYPKQFDTVDNKYKSQLSDISKKIDELNEKIKNAETEVKYYDIKYDGRPSKKLKEAVEIRKKEIY